MEFFESPEIEYNFIKELNKIYSIKFTEYKKKIIKYVIEKIKIEDKLLKNISIK